MSDDDLPGPARAVAAVAGMATAIWATWCTVIAFIGGTMPVLGWKVSGGLGEGLVWLFLVEPILVTVVTWIVAAVVAVIATASSGSGRR